MKLLRAVRNSLLILSLTAGTPAFASNGDSGWGSGMAIFTGVVAGAAGGYLFLRNTDNPTDSNAIAATLAGAGIGLAAGMTVSLFMGSDSPVARGAPRPIGILVSKQF